MMLLGPPKGPKPIKFIKSKQNQSKQNQIKSNLFAQQLTLYRQNHIHLGPTCTKTYYVAILLQIQSYIK